MPRVWHPEHAAERRGSRARVTVATVRRLGDRYELRHLLGRGGMGEVWAASDLLTGHEVAVKTVAGDATEAAGRLRHEAAVTAAVDHAGVVDVHDAGEDDAVAYLVMDLVPGTDLGELLLEGAVPATEAVRIAAGVADALAATHRAGIVHGDVKPANVVVSDGGVVLVDFGAASSGRAEPLAYGTAHYMAPEQALTRVLTPATDIYALGCLLHAALTGRPPFPGDSALAVLQRHAREQPPRLGEQARGVPPELDALVARMLAKDPEQRGTAAQVRDGLAAVAGLGSLAGIEPLPAADEPAGLDPQATLPAVTMLPGPAVSLPQAA